MGKVKTGYRDYRFGSASIQVQGTGCRESGLGKIGVEE